MTLPLERKAFTRVTYSLLVIFALLLAGALAFRFLEKLSWLDSFYLATVTLTTIGYGDITPTQEATKIFVIFYALGGVATVLFLMTNVARFYIESRERQFEARFSGIRRSSLHKSIRHVGRHVRRLRKSMRIPPPPTMRR